MALLVHSWGDEDAEWVRRLNEIDPGLDVRVWPALGDGAEIDMLIVGSVPPGMFAKLPSLKAIMKLGAGVNNILDDPDRPEGVPVARLVDPNLARDMTHWAIHALLHFHRRMPEYDAMRDRREWANLGATDPSDTRVGIMGIGAIGGAVAREMARLGFPVSGWSRSPKAIEGVTCYHGRDGLDDFLAVSDFMLSVLPLTAETEGIIDKSLIAKLPRDAVVANMGRGGQQVEEDILAALESGHLYGCRPRRLPPGTLAAGKPILGPSQGPDDPACVWIRSAGADGRSGPGELPPSPGRRTSAQCRGYGPRLLTQGAEGRGGGQLPPPEPPSRRGRPSSIFIQEIASLPKKWRVGCASSGSSRQPTLNEIRSGFLSNWKVSCEPQSGQKPRAAKDEDL